MLLHLLCGLVGAELLGAHRLCSASTSTTPAPAQAAASCTAAVPHVPPPPVPVRDFTSNNADKEQLAKFVLAISAIVPPPSLGDSDEWVKFVTSVGIALKGSLGNSGESTNRMPPSPSSIE